MNSIKILAVYVVVGHQKFSETKIFESEKEILGEIGSKTPSGLLVADWIKTKSHPECILRDLHDNPSVILKFID